MVRPIKPIEVSHPIVNRRLTTRSNLNTDLEEKYRTEAPKTVNDKKKTVITKSLDKELTKKPITKLNTPNVPETKIRKTPEKRLFSTIRTQSARPESKNKVSMAKSEPSYKRKTEREIKKYKLNKGRNPAMPPAEKYFISEGKLRTTPRPNKIIGKLITPQLVESRCEDVEKELKTKFSDVTTIENSNMSLMQHYYDGLKVSDPVMNIKKKRIKKIKKNKMRLKKPKTSNKIIVTEIKESETNASKEKSKVCEIKHNDSFVISAKKLLNNPKPPKKIKPDVIKLFKRKERNIIKSGANALKPCLKKDTDGKPLQSFGEKLANPQLKSLIRKVKMNSRPKVLTEKTQSIETKIK